MNKQDLHFPIQWISSKKKSLTNAYPDASPVVKTLGWIDADEFSDLKQNSGK